MSDSQTIYMTVLRDDDFLSRYWSRKPLISEDVARFLEHEAEPPEKSARQNLTIEIASDEISQGGQKLYTQAIHNYYADQLVALQRERKRNLYSSIGLIVLGTVILCVMVVYEQYVSRPVISEIIDIIGWVFIWEAVDQLWFDRHRLNSSYHLRQALCSASVSYTPLSKKAEQIYQEENAG